MKERSQRWLSASLLAVATAVLAAGPVAMSVQVKNAQMRATPSFLGAMVAPLNYGDRLQVVEQQGDWAKVTTPDGKTGWVHNSALTKKKIAMSAGDASAQTAASTDEMALAGKGFNAAVEADFRARNQQVDFTWVDRMERLKVTPEQMEKFLKEGGIVVNEGGKP